MLAKTCPPASQPSKSTIPKGRVQGSAPAVRSQGDISLNLSNSLTVIHGLPSSPSLPTPQPKRPHPAAHKRCALIEPSSSSTPLHLATSNDDDGERNENNRKGKRKASIESVPSCKEDISTENLRPTKHRRLVGAAPVVHKHEQFWILDGNTVLEVGGVLFKLHRSRLVDQSTFFAGLLDELDVQVDDSVVVESDENGTVYHLSNTTSKDLEALLQLDRNQMTYYFTPPPFPVLAAIIRAATALGFGTHRAFAVRLLENAWSSSLADLSTDEKPNAMEVVVLARTCGIERVLKRAFYEMVRVRVVDYGLSDSELVADNGEGSQEIGRTDERRLERMREHLLLMWSQVANRVDSSSTCPNQPKETSGSVLGFPASTGPSSSTSLAHSSKCPSLSSKRDAWERRVHDSGLYDEYQFDPLCGLQALIDIKWDVDEGWCSDCVRARRDAWTRLRQITWEHIGVLIGLEA
ncbi:hypothetical protein DFJ58DRAFT_338325 [Suillus subalutaceus]|uniref:uncharacterized protein n=1 Tax=Suillus subalutaceus TaxID=48586 RepID=UPI001B87E417|nr:uncharacterized protein DFJ58DRAFT_338325 [Suillus subalutaceus]KAG1856674.1 hypothetical protein DFJ58DRAFT_338325 [Suillus subalutaceus]